MQVFRATCLRPIFTAFTAAIFLNMGFFLMEVRLLELHKDIEVMTNIAKMITGGAFEEERDGSASSTGGTLAEEEYVAGHHGKTYTGSYYLIAEHFSVVSNNDKCHYGYLKKFSPPPEFPSVS